jgi:RNA polymerase sigma-70 factor (ECF subfamily)
MKTEPPLLNPERKMDKEAIVKAFDLYATPLYNYAARLCGDSLLADHIVGDVFAKLLEQLAAGKGPHSNLRAYLYETAYHLIVDESRSSNRRAPLEALSSLKPDVRASRLGSEEQLLLEKVLVIIQDKLTDDQRHVIILRFLEEFSLRETAAIVGKDVNHVKVIQSRALAKLRKAFEYDERKTPTSLPRVDDVSRALGT